MITKPGNEPAKIPFTILQQRTLNITDLFFPTFLDYFEKPLTPANDRLISDLCYNVQ